MSGRNERLVYWVDKGLLNERCVEALGLEGKEIDLGGPSVSSHMQVPGFFDAIAIALAVAQRFCGFADERGKCGPWN